MDTPFEGLESSALRVNLARTAAQVEIPQAHMVLLDVVDGFYGTQKQTREFLEEFHHPYRNWEFVLQQLKAISFRDFYKHNRHDNGLEALKIIVEMYVEISRSAPTSRVREQAVEYLFDYLKKILSDSNERLARNIEIFPFVLQSLITLAENEPTLLRKSSTPWKSLLESFLRDHQKISRHLLGTISSLVLRVTYDFWLSQPDPSDWFVSYGEGREGLEAYRNLVGPLTHDNMKRLRAAVNDETAAIPAPDGLRTYLRMPDYFQIANGYLRVADGLERSVTFAGHQHLVRLDFLFNIINVRGLSDVHGVALREINRSLSMVFKEEAPDKLDEFIAKVFTLLKRSSSRDQYQDTVFSCITTLAKEIFGTKNHSLVDVFINEVIDFGFQYPDVRGTTSEWQVQVNPGHIKNIRCWLDIISLKPRWTKRLLSALIVNLKLGGVFVRDTDLLQKDISALLNTKIAPAFNLVKQLSRLFPIYFSEIGAEGELRDISTNVDELAHRNDKLIHFVRKQSHVESNSLLVPFVEHIFRYWYSADTHELEPYLPPDVLQQVVNVGEYFDDLHAIFSVLFPKVGRDPTMFLDWDEARIRKEIAAVKGVSERDGDRAFLMIRLYQLLYKKYNPQHIGLVHNLEASHLFDPARIESLEKTLNRKKHYKSVSILLEFLALLKNKMLDPAETVAFENIYHKRHIAAGIPSMYGTYREEKFDALGLSLRVERLAAILFDQLVESLNLKFITKSTLAKIHDSLWLLVKALELDGIATEGFVAKLKYLTGALQSNIFSIDQYLDIFTFISKGIQDIIRDYYIDTHRPNLSLIVAQVMDRRSDRNDLTSVEREEITYQMSENFIRSAIASTFGLQILDTFVSNIIRSLNAELEKFKDNTQILNLVMTYDPDSTVSSLQKRRKDIDNQILLGNKGYFLKELTSYGFPIPPGFIITTEVFRCYDAVVAYKYMSKDLSLRILNELVRLERLTGRRYGDPKNPLLLSVRSGAAISLPGMMNSFLNVGINEQIAEGLGRKKGYEWAAWDSYRRFLQVWGMFQGLGRNFFDQIMEHFKRKFAVSKKIRFTPGQMREIALAYRTAMEHEGIQVIDDPSEQLRHAVLQVFASWHSSLAKVYRDQMNLSHQWGTAVIVQSMVFGNLNEQSGSGVTFTRNPKGLSSEVSLFGDFIFGVQGDDIVGGLVVTFPISENQRKSEQRSSGISLENTFPEIYAELVRLSDELIYEKGFNHQEIEFTFERPEREGLYILQTRDMVQIDAQRLSVFQDTQNLRDSFLGIGIGVGGGALCGKVVYSEDEIRLFRSAEPETPLVLIRPDTVPDDVNILLQVDGLLTARGGSTSHAAVTIPQLKKVGVVGFNKLQVYESDGYSVIGKHTVKGGDYIAIDGWSGAVYLGWHGLENDPQPRDRPQGIPA